MTEAEGLTATEQTITNDPISRGVSSGRRAETEVIALAFLLAVAAALLFLAAPDRGDSLRPAGWWAFPAVLVLFGLFEYLPFNVEFREQAISFSLSEIPTAFALVFLTPGLAIAARVPVTLAVLIFVRRNALYKLVFNVPLVVFELMLAVVLVRGFADWWGGGDGAVLAAVMLALIMVSPLTSVLISIAISRFEGGTWRRIKGQLRATWWMYIVNSALGAMTVSLALVEPALALLAVLPVGGIWYVLHSYGQLSQRKRELDEVHGFAGRVGHTLDVTEISNSAVAETVRLLRADEALLVRRDDAGTWIIHRHGNKVLHLPTSMQESAVIDLIGTREVRMLDASLIRAAGGELLTTAPRVIIAPIVDETGPIAMLLIVERESPIYRFGDHDVSRVQDLAEQLAASLRKGMLHKRLEYEARHDALTDLPARTMFELAVGEMVETTDLDGVVCVLMLDLDRFKEVNDTLGHHAGDDLLVQFSQRIGALLEPDDVLARLAGDEFAVLCHRATIDDVAEFAHDAVGEGGKPVVLDGLEIVVTVSVGVASITAEDHDAVQPMRRADIAMYNAKWQRTGVEFYRDEIDRRTPARLSMLGDLRAAIKGDGLDVVYQPKLEVATGRVVGVEALVRWEHETRGMVAPSEFVRVAEDTGLIKELTDLVLARGIGMLASFHAAGLKTGLAVNLSTHDLFDGRLPDRVRAYLDDQGVHPKSLTLEITESSLFVDAPRTRATIDGLHEVGIRMAVDDFGTGYSSLSYLRRLPVHELKIDQSFVFGMLTDPQDEVIVRSTVDLGHNLGLRVVAEGVESAAVLERLREFGCDIAQGFYIAQPIAGDEILDWLREADAAYTAGMSDAWLESLN